MQKTECRNHIDVNDLKLSWGRRVIHSVYRARGCIGYLIFGEWNQNSCQYYFIWKSDDHLSSTMKVSGEEYFIFVTVIYQQISNENDDT